MHECQGGPCRGPRQLCQSPQGREQEACDAGRKWATVRLYLREADQSPQGSGHLILTVANKTRRIESRNQKAMYFLGLCFPPFDTHASLLAHKCLARTRRAPPTSPSQVLSAWCHRCSGPIWTNTMSCWRGKMAKVSVPLTIKWHKGMLLVSREAIFQKFIPGESKHVLIFSVNGILGRNASSIVQPRGPDRAVNLSQVRKLCLEQQLQLKSPTHQD